MATPGALADCRVVTITPQPAPARSGGTPQSTLRITSGSWSARVPPSPGT
ncbi:hypothetical protein GQF42_15575 [Streptomyces broussonetiae]|uniref:Uncharacterized protein n=1 Tax=Streptomyces broussonetiae TaxID=2686304 RepID=A0A6I6N7V8_9ACTN|nr:hypothetical protein GQF42_15575 [Streptomyces broussonetiae]